MKRSWCIADGLATTVYKIRPRQSGPWLDVMIWFPWWPFDAIITVDGTEVAVSRAVPPAHDRAVPGAFTVKDVQRAQDERSQRVDFVLEPLPDQPRIAVTLHAELIDDQPLLRTWLTIRNDDAVPHVIQRIALETVYPIRQEMEHLTTWHDVEIGDDPRFIGCSMPRTRTLFDRALPPGATMDSFALLSAACPSDSRWHIAARHDLIHAFAPHTRHPKLLQQYADWRDLADLRQSVDEAGELGIEVVLAFVHEGWSYGDLDLNPKLFPRGDADLRELCDYARAGGVEIGFYLGECIAHPGARVLVDHPDWQFLGENGSRYDPGGIGNMCPSSGWGEHVHRKVDHLMDLGVAAFQTDGPPYHQTCHEPSHNHGSPQTAKLDNWHWEREFNRHMVERGAFVQSPTGIEVLFDGVAQIPGGYTEDDQSVLVGLDQVTQFRANLLINSEKYPPSARWGFFLIGDLFSSRPGMVNDPENELVRFEHGLAGHLGYGFSACLHGKHLFNGPRSKAIAQRWLGFYKRYRPLLTGRTLPLRIPDSRGLDAVMHCSPTDNPCAVVVVFNPSEQERRGYFTLPLEFAGWEPGRAATLRRNGAGEATPISIDDQGNALLDMTLTAGTVEWWEVTWGSETKSIRV
jgi:hypothetical protein